MIRDATINILKFYETGGVDLEKSISYSGKFGVSHQHGRQWLLHYDLKPLEFLISVWRMFLWLSVIVIFLSVLQKPSGAKREKQKVLN